LAFLTRVSLRPLHRGAPFLRPSTRGEPLIRPSSYSRRAVFRPSIGEVSRSSGPFTRASLRLLQDKVSRSSGFRHIGRAVKSAPTKAIRFKLVGKKRTAEGPLPSPQPSSKRQPLAERNLEDPATASRTPWSLIQVKRHSHDPRLPPLPKTTASKATEAIPSVSDTSVQAEETKADESTQTEPVLILPLPPPVISPTSSPDASPPDTTKPPLTPKIRRKLLRAKEKIKRLF